LKGCFEIIKGQTWISSKGEKRRDKKKKKGPPTLNQIIVGYMHYLIMKGMSR